MTAEKKLAKDLSGLFCKDAQVSQVVLLLLLLLLLLSRFSRVRLCATP